MRSQSVIIATTVALAAAVGLWLQWAVLVAIGIGVGVAALGTRFLRTLGYSPHEAIVRARIEAASRLLRETRLTIDAIAEKAGFRHGEYLTAVFRQRCGTTPRAYRNRHGMQGGPPRSAK